jgi:hypothetical protein
VPPFDRTSETSPDAALLVEEAMGDLARDPSDDHTLEALVEAVTAAPGSARARYGLACALSRRGDELGAARELDTLAIADCPACDDALANLSTDLGCGWTDARRSIAPLPSTARRATLLLADAVRSGDPALAAAHFRRRVTYDSVCSVCDDDAGDVRRSSSGPALLRSLVGDPDDDHWMVFGDRFFCDASCCTFDIGFLSHSHSFVSQVCFSGSQVTSFSEIDGG